MSESKPYDVLMNKHLKMKLLETYQYQQDEPYDMTNMDIFLRETTIVLGLIYNTNLLSEYMYRMTAHARYINEKLNPQVKNIDTLRRMIMDAEYHRLQYVMSP